MNSGVLLIVAALLSEPSANASCACTKCGGAVKQSAASPLAANTNFVVRSGSTTCDAADLLKHAEAKRQVLCDQWLGAEGSKTAWTPRCEVVLHRDRSSFAKAVGAAGSSTSGSTLVRFSEGKVSVRRIDLLADPKRKYYDTLAHELVHAIFAERFPKSVPPRWAEEGAALLADAETKQSAHRADFARLHSLGRTFKAHELVRMTDYPALQRFPEFYGQSLVLVEFLTAYGESGDFIRFVELSLSKSTEAALQEVYGITTASELENLWTSHIAKGTSTLADSR